MRHKFNRMTANDHVFAHFTVASLKYFVSFSKTRSYIQKCKVVAVLISANHHAVSFSSAPYPYLALKLQMQAVKVVESHFDSNLAPHSAGLKIVLFKLTPAEAS